MRFVSTITVALLLGASAAISSELKGRVTDSEGNGLPSVSVVTNLSSVGTMTDPDGNYQLKILDQGDEPVTRVTFSSVGYHPRQFNVGSIPAVIVLQEQYYRGTDILVRGDRAQRGQSPLAFSNFSADKIKRDYTVGEFPLMLETTPNFFVYTDGGASLGYAYTSIRGFDDKRITTYINGVPLNDPEWQATYFVDLPDFAANIDDIQVQRGVGNSLYGDASFGGTINVVTNSLARERRTVLTTGYGEYTSGGKSVADIYRSSLEYSSGLIDGHWNFSGRFSKQKTSGYREHSWYEGWSYYFGLARLDPNMTTELYVYGGPMKMHLAFWGAGRDDITKNRRFNPRTYGNETDNFNQPHYHLHNTARLSDDVTLSNTLYYIRGKGHYEQMAEFSLFADYGIGSSMIAIDTSTGQSFTDGDLVRQDLVRKSQYGWNPRLDVDHARGRHTVGGSVYYFRSDHSGVVSWAQNIAGPLDPRHEFYRWDGRQWVGSAYVQEQYRVNDRLTGQATAQVRYQRFEMDEEQVGAFVGHNYDMDWLFVSPRLGFTYAVNESVSLFTNFAISSRPPIVATIYDGTNPNVQPLMEITSVNSDSTVYTFGDPLIEAERVYDFELGGEYRGERLAASANLFWMDFHDEILPYGTYNPFTGLRAAVNADRTLHAGIEFSAAWQLADKLKVDGNFSYNYNRVKDFTIDLDGYQVDFADKKIPGFPDYLGSLVIDGKLGNWRVTPRVKLIGRRYMELENIEPLSLDPFVVASLSLGYTFDSFLQLGRLTISGRVDNLGDKKYETYGYGWVYAYDDGSGNTIVDGGAEYYVAPERSFYGQLQLEMF